MVITRSASFRPGETDAEQAKFLQQLNKSFGVGHFELSEELIQAQRLPLLQLGIKM
jgi:hypothetical protein